jgi:ATP adenylyltransferase
MGCNLGSVAGAGIAGHLHFHLVPRWKGDTNFMPVIADTSVISDHIMSTRDKIAEKLPC